MSLALSYEAKVRVLFELQMALENCDENVMPERHESLENAIREINQVPSK